MSPDELRAHLLALQSVTEAVLAHLVLPELLRELLSRLREVLSVDAATVLLCTKGGKTLEVRASKGLEEAAEQHVEIPVGQGIAGAVAARRQAVIVDDVPRIESAHPMLHRLSSMMVAPLLAEGDLVGVLHVGTLRPRNFDAAELYLLRVVADRVALAIKNALTYDRLQEEARGRAAAETVLADREAHFRILAETTTDAIITMAADGTIVSANPAAARLFGYNLDDLHGRPMVDLIPERHRAAHRAGVERYARTRERRIPWSSLELPGLRSDGTEVLLEVSFAERIRDGEHLFTGTMRDITERRASRRLAAAQLGVARVLATSDSEEAAVPRILGAIGESLGWDLGLFWKPEGAVLRAREVWTARDVDGTAFAARSRELGFRPGEGLPGRVWNDRKPVWSRDVTREENFHRRDVAARTGVRAAFAFPICVGDSLLGIAEFFTHEIEDPDLALLEALEALGSDVAQFLLRCEAEARLRRSEEVQRFFARASAAFVAAALDYEATLRRLATLAVPALGDWCTVYALREDGGVDRLEIAHADPEKEPLAQQLGRYPAHPRHPVYRVLRTGEPLLVPDIPEELLDQVAHDDDHRRIMCELGLRSGLIVPLSARGRMLGALVLVSSESGRRYDRDDLEIAQEFARRAALAIDNARLFGEVEEANRSKSEFLAVMSHELRTPLNAVIGYAELIGMDVGGDNVLRYAQRIGLAARHLSQLIEEVLAFSSLEAGRHTVSLEPVLLHDVLEELRAIAEPLAAQKGLALSVHAPEEPVEIITDAGKVRQILLNLVANAIKFTEEGAVELAGEGDGEWALVTVRDTGIGIAPEHHQKIFDPFWQVDQGTTRSAGGTGLGLSVTRRLANALGGDVELESEVGAGTTVRVRIPLRPEPRAESPAPGDWHGQ